jgi:hypothetical protein
MGIEVGQPGCDPISAQTREAVMVGRGVAVAAGAVVLLLAQGASADVAEGTIKSISLIRNTFVIGDMTYN